MNIETDSVHITPPGGNVFADLGFPLEEAAELHAEAQRVIAGKLAMLSYEPAGKVGGSGAERS